MGCKFPTVFVDLLSTCIKSKPQTPRVCLFISHEGFSVGGSSGVSFGLVHIHIRFVSNPYSYFYHSLCTWLYSGGDGNNSFWHWGSFSSVYPLCSLGSTWTPDAYKSIRLLVYASKRLFVYDHAFTCQHEATIIQKYWS